VTGADIIGALLLADAPVLALAPAGQIKEDRLPDDAPLTALLVRTVSSVDRQTLKLGQFVRRTDRIAVTVRAADVRARKAAMAAVRKCCAGRTGDLGGALRVSILTAGTGPSLNGPGNSFEQTQDFRVSFDAIA
jgi:hypothetical protein